MSRPDFVYWGSIPLKPGVTPADVIATIRRQWGPESDQLPLEVDQPDHNGNWICPDDWEVWGNIHLWFHNGEANYSFTGQFHWSFDEEFEAWLGLVYPLVAAGWESREGDELDQDDECMVFRGPDLVSIAKAKVEEREIALKVAQEMLQEAQKELEEAMR